MPRLRPLLPALALIALALAPPARLDAAFVIDQSNVISNTALTSARLGQSFTPGLAAIQQGTFTLFGTTAADTTYTISLFSGAGFGGTSLATTTTLLAANSSLIQYDFGQAITLTPGSVYTLGISRVDGALFTLQVGTGNPYAGGTAYTSGSSFNGGDLVFSEGPNSVPEPASFVLVGLGLASAGLTHRVRSRPTTHLRS